MDELNKEIDKAIDELRELKIIFDVDVCEGKQKFVYMNEQLTSIIRKIPVEVSPKNCLRCIYGDKSKNVKAKCEKIKPGPHVPFEDGKWMCHDFCVRTEGGIRT